MREIPSYTSLENYEEALSDSNKAWELRGNEKTIGYLQGFIFTVQADYKKALSCFDKILVKDGQHLYSHLHRGYCYQQLQNYSTAKQIYQQLLGRIPQDMPFLKDAIWVQQGLLYEQQANTQTDVDKKLKRIAQALEAIESAQAYLENSSARISSIPWQMAMAQQTLNDIPQIHSRLRKQKKQLQQLKAQQWVAIAQDYHKHEIFDLALQHCEHALALDKNCIDAHALEGDILQRQGKWDKAAICFQEVKRLDLHYKGITANLSKVQQKSQSQEERKQHEHWLKEVAPQAIIDGVLEGLVKGVPAHRELGLNIPLSGVAEEDTELDRQDAQQLRKTLLRLLHSSRLLNEHVTKDYLPIVVYKLVEYVSSLFPGTMRQAGSSSKQADMKETVAFKKGIELKDIEKEIRKGIAKAQAHIEKQEKIKAQQVQKSPEPVSLMQAKPSTLFAQRQSLPKSENQPSDIILQETGIVETVFGESIEYASALVVLMRGKDQKHAFLVMMRLTEYNILEMHSYHFNIHPNDNCYGLVNMGEEKIILSEYNTEELLDKKQNEILRRKEFTDSEADSPLQNFHRQHFMMSRTEAIQLHINVTADASKSRKMQMPYFKWGNKALANKSLSTVPGHNCYTWAREKLEDIGKKVSHSWIDYIATDPSYHLNDKTCSIM